MPCLHLVMVLSTLLPPESLLLLPGLLPESLPAAKAGALNANARAEAAANMVILVISSVVMAKVPFCWLIGRRRITPEDMRLKSSQSRSTATDIFVTKSRAARQFPLVGTAFHRCQ